jgi:hypothetical protein
VAPSSPAGNGGYALLQRHWKRREERSDKPVCYTRKEERDLDTEARRILEGRLMEEEARHRQEEHDRRRAKEQKPLTKKVKEVGGVR